MCPSVYPSRGSVVKPLELLDPDLILALTVITSSITKGIRPKFRVLVKKNSHMVVSECP